MVSSMTGYGFCKSEKDDIGLTVELRSVNHRYLDLYFRIPKEIQQWEDKLRSYIKSKVARGRVEINISIQKIPEDVVSVKVNESLLSAYLNALKEIKDIASIKSELNLSNVLKFSEVLVIENNLAEDERIETILINTLEKALDALIMQRKREGSNLKSDLLERCLLIEDNINKLTIRVPEVNENYRKKLYQKLKDIEGGFFDESRILTECAVFVERNDVNEELVRLNSHLEALKASLVLSGSVGRKMDFVLQEMFREINTVGSKSSDYEITDLVVNVKTELEKMREQVQNIE